MSDPLSAGGSRLPAAGCRLTAPGFYFLAAESRAPNPESPVSIPESRLHASGFRLPSLEPRASNPEPRQLTADSGKLIKEYTDNESSYNRSDRSAWI